MVSPPLNNMFLKAELMRREPQFRVRDLPEGGQHTRAEMLLEPQLRHGIVGIFGGEKRPAAGRLPVAARLYGRSVV